MPGRLLPAAVLAFGLFTLTACSAQRDFVPAAPHELTLAEALAQLNALPVPAGADVAQFEELRSSLRASLEHSGITRWTSAAPTDPANKITGLFLNKLDDSTAIAHWTYRNVGDYDQNSEVNIADLSALGGGLSKTSDAPDWMKAKVADGDGNGEVNISDLTPLGSHLQKTVDSYSIQFTNTPAVESSWNEMQQITFDYSSSPSAGVRMYSVILLANVGGYYRVVPMHAGSPGIPSDPVEYTGSMTGPDIPAEEIDALLDLGAAKLDNLTTTTSDEQDLEIATYLMTLPHVEEAGYETGSAWARLTSGEMVFVVKNRKPQPPGAQSSALRSVPAQAGQNVIRLPSGVGLPKSKSVELFGTFGPIVAGQQFFAESGPELDDLFLANGYNALVIDGHIEELKTVTDCGCFYIDSHGGRGFGPGRNPLYSFWIHDKVTRDLINANRDDLRAGRLAYMLALGNSGKIEKHFAVTPEFVRTYMDFAENSFVWLNCCNSGNSSEMADAFFDAGASVYAGWTISVYDDDAYFGVIHLFDRMLGANELGRTEDPPIRPFEFYITMFDMAQRGVSALGQPVQYPSYPGSGFSVYSSMAYYLDDDDIETGFMIFAPTISVLAMFDNWDEDLWVVGRFGDLQDKVTVDGTEVEILSWEDDVIHVRLPRDGAGSSGDVVVEVDGHKSNPRRLTEWRGQMLLEGETPEGLKRSTTFDLHFRSDINDWRQLPDTFPLYKGPSIDSTVHLWGAMDSVATVSAEGEFTDDQDYTRKWESPENSVVPIIDVNAQQDYWFHAHGELNLDTMLFELDFYVNGELHETVTDDMGATVTDHMLTFTDDSYDFAPDGLVQITMDPDYTLVGGNLQGSSGSLDFSLNWGDMFAINPPDPDAPR